jgi:RimJ/RimL family protein N-acetyltransferase
MSGMPPASSLSTERLRLRQWRDSDREPFAALNNDPVVMAHFPARRDRAESDRQADRISAEIAERGWGFWAVEVRASGEFAGFVGLNPVADNLPFAPGVEIGWRLATRFWGQGYATEGAQRVVAYGFEELGLSELVAFTTRQNGPSQRVMAKLGMIRDPADDFEFPGAPDWAERACVLYRLAARPFLPGPTD